MAKKTDPAEQNKQCVFSTTGIAKFTDTHCLKDCQWIVYGHVNIAPALNNVGICCACREVLKLDYKTNEFKRLDYCIKQTDILNREK